MKRLLVIIAALLVAATTPLPAAAQAGPPGAGRQVPLSSVLREIAAHQPGRHLNTTMGDAGGRPAYFVQWQLSDGRVVIFVVDAESGQIIGRH